MSWATHELENYFIQRHAKLSVSFLAVALGAFGPDLVTKGFVYGVHVGPIQFGSDSPVEFHRDWPGAGFTHSLLVGVIIGALILRFARSRSWALGFVIGYWAHVVTDINDTAGTMLFFPFSTAQISTGMWKHAASTGRYNDAAAYYSSPGALWDMFWLAMVLLFARDTLRRTYFRDVVVAADPRAWAWIGRRLHIGERGLLAIYRGWFFYATCRIIAWTLFARFRVKAPIDYRWGGPSYVEAISLYEGTWRQWLLATSLGAAATALTLLAAWRVLLSRWWTEAGDARTLRSMPPVENSETDVAAAQPQQLVGPPRRWLTVGSWFRLREQQRGS